MIIMLVHRKIVWIRSFGSHDVKTKGIKECVQEIQSNLALIWTTFDYREGLQDPVLSRAMFCSMNDMNRRDARVS